MFRWRSMTFFFKAIVFCLFNCNLPPCSDSRIVGLLPGPTFWGGGGRGLTFLGAGVLFPLPPPPKKFLSRQNHSHTSSHCFLLAHPTMLFCVPNSFIIAPRDGLNSFYVIDMWLFDHGESESTNGEAYVVLSSKVFPSCWLFSFGLGGGERNLLLECRVGWGVKVWCWGLWE